MGPRGGEQGGGTPRRTGQLGPTPVKRSHVRSGQPPQGQAKTHEPPHQDGRHTHDGKDRFARLALTPR